MSAVNMFGELALASKQDDIIEALQELGFVTDAELRATPLPVVDQGVVDALEALGFQTDAVTNAQLRATPLPVIISDGSGPVTVDGTVAISGTVPVSGPLTDAQLRASAINANTFVTNTTGNPVPVSDAGGSLTVDGTVAVSNFTDNGLTDAQLRASAVPVSAALSAVGVTATSLAKAEDAPHTSGDTGVFMLGVRNTAFSTLTSAEGDYSPVAVDAFGRSMVAISDLIPGAGATNLGKAEDAPHASSDVGVMALAVRSDAGGTTASASGDYVPLITDSVGALRTTAFVTSVVPGVTGSSLGKAEDAVHADGDTGVMMLGVRNANGTVLTSAEGDYSAIAVDGTGKVLINPGTAATNLGKAEDAAHTTGDTGVMMLAVRSDAGGPLTDVTGDYHPLLVDSLGRLSTSSAVSTGTGAFGISAAAMGKAEDAAHVSGDVGTMALAVRNDTAAVLTSADGDYSPVAVDSAGRIKTSSNQTATGSITTQNLVPAGVATAGSAVEISLNGATTLGIQTSGTYTGALSLQVTVDGTNWLTIGAPMIIGGTNGALNTTISSGAASVFQAEVAGYLKARITGLSTMTGTAVVTLIATEATAVTVLGAALPSGTNSIGSLASISTFVNPGTGAANLGKAEDAAHASGDTGVMLLAVRNDSPSSLVDANGDYASLQLDGTGNLRVSMNGVGLVPGTAATSMGKAEDAAHTSGDTGIFMLGVRNDSATVLTSADGDYSPVATDSAGRLQTNVSVLSGAFGISAGAMGKSEDAAHASGDTGVAIWGVRMDVNGIPTSADGDYGALGIDQHGSQFVVPGRVGTATLTNVNGAATTTSLLTANTSRKAVIMHNDSTATLFLKYGATASVTSYTYKIAPDATWEMPSPLFAGALDGIWSAANGAVRITELTG
jgi:hypothetical protein